MGPLGPSSTSSASQTAAPRAEIISRQKCTGSASPAGRLEARLPVRSFAKLLSPACCAFLQLPRGPARQRALHLHARSSWEGREGPLHPASSRAGGSLDRQRLLAARPLPAKAPRAAGPPPRWKGRMMKEIGRCSVKRQANLDQMAGNVLSNSAQEPGCGKLCSGRRSSKTNRELPSGAGWRGGRMGERRGSGQAKP